MTFSRRRTANCRRTVSSRQAVSFPPAVRTVYRRIKQAGRTLAARIITASRSRPKDSPQRRLPTRPQAGRTVARAALRLCLNRLTVPAEQRPAQVAPLPEQAELPAPGMPCPESAAPATPRSNSPVFLM